MPNGHEDESARQAALAEQAKKIADYTGGAQDILAIAEDKYQELQSRGQDDRAAKFYDLSGRIIEHLGRGTAWTSQGQVVVDHELARWLAINWADELTALMEEDESPKRH